MSPREEGKDEAMTSTPSSPEPVNHENNQADDDVEAKSSGLQRVLAFYFGNEFLILVVTAILLARAVSVYTRIDGRHSSFLSSSSSFFA